MFAARGPPGKRHKPGGGPICWKGKREKGALRVGMELLEEYIRPELMLLVAVLYLVGGGLKRSREVPDDLIPLLLGAFGVFLALLWVVSTTAPASLQEWTAAGFTALVQGILVAGQAVYVHQLGHQRKKARQPSGQAAAPAQQRLK